MNAQPREEQSLLVRVDRLERENARLKRIGTIVLLLMSVILLTGQAKQSTISWQKQVLRAGTIQANTIEVLPEEGSSSSKGFSPVPLLRIVGSPVGAELTMFDGSGKARVSLNSSLGLLQMGELESDSTGHVRSANSGSIRIEGSLFGSELTMYDEHGEARVSLADRKGGGDPSLFLGRNDSYRTVIGSTGLVTAAGKHYDTSAASVVLFDPKGNVIWSAEQAQQLLPLVDYLQTQKALSANDDSKRELDEFKEAACPILKTARVAVSMRMKLDSACGLH